MTMKERFLRTPVEIHHMITVYFSMTDHARLDDVILHEGHEKLVLHLSVYHVPLFQLSINQ